MITKPMLAGKCEDINALQFPILCTPKLDGIRCLKINGKAVSRTFKPIPNKFIRETIEAYFPDGCDGEIICPGKTFSEISSAVMSEDGSPNFNYHVFDHVGDSLTEEYRARMNRLKNFGHYSSFLVMVLPVRIDTIQGLEKFEEECLARGYEGVMIRSMNGPYKCGRSTEREGYLLKLKRFEDSEAEIIGFEEKYKNANEAKEDLLGHTKRSSHQENMIPMNTLGALRVRDLVTKLEFSIGTGFDDETRAEIWGRAVLLTGRIVKYKHQKSGAKDLPRFPVFLGFRDKRDM